MTEARELAERYAAAARLLQTQQSGHSRRIEIQSILRICDELRKTYDASDRELAPLLDLLKSEVVALGPPYQQPCSGALKR